MNGLPVADHIGRTVAEVLDVRDAESLTALQRDVLVTGRPVIDLVSPAPGGHGHRSLSYHRLADRAGRVLGISAHRHRRDRARGGRRQGRAGQAAARPAQRRRLADRRPARRRRDAEELAACPGADLRRLLRR